MADAVRHERDRLLSDPGEYQRLYGVPVEVVQRAMAQNYSRHALRQENLERLLGSAGFVTIKLSFRRFIGEDLCRKEGGEALVSAVQSHLVSLLPLTRGLFKYFVLVAR